MFQVFIAQILNGLSLGSIYVLLATSFNLLLLVALIIHFAYPQVVVFSMYIIWLVLKATGNNLFLGILAGVLSSIVLNVLSSVVFQKVMSKRASVDINSTMVVSMGMGFVITDILSHSFNKGFPITYPEKLIGGKPILHIGLISIQQGQVWSILIGAVAVSAFFVLLYKTRAGRAFRAIAEDPVDARLVGIPLIKTGFQSYALAGILGGLSAVLIAMLLQSATPGLGDMLAHKVLAVSIVAGLGNLAGGLVVGLSLGVIEALIQGYFAGSWSNAIAFVLMLIIVLWKPKGLFGIKV